MTDLHSPGQLEHDIARSKLLRPGGDHYRAYVGPPGQYDFMGASQFRLLTSLGLQEIHRVLDIGCGSLRAGRFLIHYLLPHRYTGIEPNDWLWQAAFEREIGADVLNIKYPRFDREDDFCLKAVAARSQDFVLAQSVYSHAGADIFDVSVRAAAKVLGPAGQFLFTAIVPGAAGFARLELGIKTQGWKYPDCLSYTEEEVRDICARASLRVQKLAWFHPRQAWFRAVADPDLLLSREDEQEMGSGKPLFDPRFPRKRA